MQKTIAKVSFLKGTAYIVNMKTKTKTFLTVGDKIELGVIIKTGKKSRVLIELKNGIKWILPGNSQLALIKATYLKTYLKADKSVDKMTAFVGIKGDEGKIKLFTSKKQLLKKIKELFQNKAFFKLVKTIEENNILDFENNQCRFCKEYDFLYFYAVSYLKLGQTKISRNLFERLLNTGIYEYKKMVYYGLCLTYIKEGNQIEAQKLLKYLLKSPDLYKEIKKQL